MYTYTHNIYTQQQQTQEQHNNTVLHFNVEPSSQYDFSHAIKEGLFAICLMFKGALLNHFPSFWLTQQYQQHQQNDQQTSQAVYKSLFILRNVFHCASFYDFVLNFSGFPF